MSYQNVQYAPILCTLVFIKYLIFYFLFEFFWGGFVLSPLSISLFSLFCWLCGGKGGPSLQQQQHPPTPSPFFSWEQKPQDVDPGVAAELTKSFQSQECSYCVIFMALVVNPKQSVDIRVSKSVSLKNLNFFVHFMTCLLDFPRMTSYCFWELGLGLIKPWGNSAM